MRKELLSLLDTLEQFSILSEGTDKREWIPSKDGAFSAMIPRYDMDTVGIGHGYGKDMDFTCKK